MKRVLILLEDLAVVSAAPKVKEYKGKKGMVFKPDLPLKGALLLLILLSLTFSAERAIVSVYPFYDVVKEIGGYRFKTEVLIPPQVDFHLYELTSGDILKLRRAKVVFVSGAPLGGWELKVEELSRGKVFRLYGRSHDPHVWMSPKRMIRVAENAYRAFSSVDPEGRETFKENLEKVLRRLRELHEAYRSVLSRCSVRVLPIEHPSLGYLAEDYGLTQISFSRGDVHGGVSPHELLHFLEELKEKRINFIFVPYGVRTKAAPILEKEYGVKVFRLNVEILPGEGGGDYFSIMKHNLSVLKEALRCM